MILWNGARSQCKLWLGGYDAIRRSSCEICDSAKPKPLHNKNTMKMSYHHRMTYREVSLFLLFVSFRNTPSRSHKARTWMIWNCPRFVSFAVFAWSLIEHVRHVSRNTYCILGFPKSPRSCLHCRWALYTVKHQLPDFLPKCQNMTSPRPGLQLPALIVTVDYLWLIISAVHLWRSCRLMK